MTMHGVPGLRPIGRPKKNLEHSRSVKGESGFKSFFKRPRGACGEKGCTRNDWRRTAGSHFAPKPPWTPGLLAIPWVIPSSIQGASHAQDILSGDMGVDHGGLEVPVAQEFLYGSDVVAVFQQVGCEAVPQGVHRCLLGNPRSKERLLERLLKGRWMDVVAADSLPGGSTTGSRRPGMARTAPSSSVGSLSRTLR